MPPRDHDEGHAEQGWGHDQPGRGREGPGPTTPPPGQMGRGSGGVGPSEYGAYQGGQGAPGWTDRGGAANQYSGGVDTGYGPQGGSGGYGPMTQGSQYAQSGSAWGHSGFGSHAGRSQGSFQSQGDRDFDAPRYEDHGSSGDRHGSGRPGQGGATYGQGDVSPGSQRSQYRQEQRSPQFDREPGFGGPGPAGGASSRGLMHDEHLGGGHDHDHEPGYVHWRSSQLESHDRDYRRWRDEQARKYDQDYGKWRGDRHEGFSRDFSDWRSRQGAGTATATPAGSTSTATPGQTGSTTPLTESTNPVESVTDGHNHAHTDDASKS